MRRIGRFTMICQCIPVDTWSVRVWWRWRKDGHHAMTLPDGSEGGTARSGDGGARSRRGGCPLNVQCDHGPALFG
jgi:hypothetical protein